MKIKVWKKYLVAFIATALMSISSVAPCAAIPSDSLKDNFTTNKGTYTEVSWNDPENGRVYYSDWNANTGQWKNLYFGDGSFFARLYLTCTADSTDVTSMQTKLETHFGEGYEIKVVSEDDIIRCWVTDRNLFPDTAEKVDALFSTFNKNDLRIFKYSPQIGELYECIGTGMIGCYIGTDEEIEAIANWVAENAPDWEFQTSGESSGKIRMKGKDVTEVDPALYLKIQYDIRKELGIAPQNYNAPETQMFDFSEEKVYFDVSGVSLDKNLSDSFTTGQTTFNKLSWNDPENGKVYYSDWNTETGKWNQLYFGDENFYARLYFEYTADSTDVTAMQTRLEKHFGEGYEIKVVSEDDIIRCWVTDRNMLSDTADKVDALFGTFSENELRVYKYAPQIGNLYKCIGTGAIGSYIGTKDQIKALADWVAENAPDWEFQTSGESSGELRMKGKGVTEVDPAQYLKIQYDIRKALDIAPQSYNIPEAYPYYFGDVKVYVGDETTYSPGDVDGNGSVDLGDALTALQTYSDVELMNQPNPLTATQFIAADMDGDGKVTIGDALTILQIYTDESLFNQ